MVQNWNDILNFIKIHIGNVNLIEYSDDDIINIIKTKTLPEFSVYSPLKAWSLVTHANLISEPMTYDEDTYQIEIPDGNEIINVENVYFRKHNSSIDEFDQYPYQFLDPRDTVMSNTFNTMISYLEQIQYYRFLPPDIIIFGLSINETGVIVELNTYHTKLETIKRDVYMKFFRKMALRDILIAIIATRSKFEQVTTPFGEVKLNMEYLNRQLEKLENEIEDYKNWLPPEKLISWID